MGPVGPIFMVGVQVWPWNIWPGQDSPLQGMAVVWIILFCNFTTLSSGQNVSGAITEVVVASRRCVGVFLCRAFLAGCTLKVEQYCQVLEHIFTSSLCYSLLYVTWVTLLSYGLM